MVLTEPQSSVNENMPLRMLLYVAMLYYKQVRRKALYQKKRIALPVPEFYELNLSDKKLKNFGLTLQEAIQQATEFCIDNNIMKEFLLAHYEEFFDMYSIQ